MKTIMIAIALIVVSPAYASECNVEIDAAYAKGYIPWSILQNKGYYQLGKAERKIVIITERGYSVYGNGTRNALVSIVGPETRLIHVSRATGSDDRGILNPSWKSLIRRAARRLPECK